MGLDPAAVIAAGAALADEVGFAGVSMERLAERVGVRAPSLYKHIDSLEAVKRGISLRAGRDLGNALAGAAAGLSGPDAVRAIADAYRGWVLAHPGCYAATVRAPAAEREAVEASQIFFEVLRGFGLRSERAVDAARALRSALHGFVSLEAAGGFGLPRSVAGSYGFLVDSIIASLQADRFAPRRTG